MQRRRMYLNPGIQNKNIFYIEDQDYRKKDRIKELQTSPFFIFKEEFYFYIFLKFDLLQRYFNQI